MLELPAEPRLARLLVEAERTGSAAEGALLAALASERDILAAGRSFGPSTTADFPPGPSDLELRARLFEDAARHRFAAEACRALGLDPGAARAVERARRQLARLLGRGPAASPDPDALRRATLAGFPDRVARRRAPGSPRAVMVGGTGVVLGRESVVREAELFVAVDLERGGGPEARVRVACAIERDWLGPAVHEVRELAFDPERGRVVERARRCYHDLVLAETVRTDVDRSAAGAVLAAVARADPAATGAVGDPERELVARLRFLARWLPELGWPADPETLLSEAIASVASGRVSFAELAARDVGGALLGLLAPVQRAALDREAPARYRLPSGRLAPVRYPRDRPPVVAARIQALFGLAATPRVAARRPVRRTGSPASSSCDSSASSTSSRSCRSRSRSCRSSELTACSPWGSSSSASRRTSAHASPASSRFRASSGSTPPIACWSSQPGPAPPSRSSCSSASPTRPCWQSSGPSTSPSSTSGRTGTATGGRSSSSRPASSPSSSAPCSTGAPSRAARRRRRSCGVFAGSSSASCSARGSSSCAATRAGGTSPASTTTTRPSPFRTRSAGGSTSCRTGSTSSWCSSTTRRAGRAVVRL